MKKIAGRPRDNKLESRVFKAATFLYAKYGWAGFNLDKISKEANVGKGSLYLRWSNKAEILIESVKFKTGFIENINTGNLRDDLIEFSNKWLEYMSTHDGVLIHRLMLDSRFFPELQNVLDKNSYPDYIKNTRTIIHRGIKRNELPQGTSVALVADLIGGSISNHIRNTPRHLLENPKHNTQKYIIQIVDTVLIGIKAKAKNENS